MREIPLLCTDEVVRAYLAGRKTQTRRPINWATNECGEPADSVCQIHDSGHWTAWWGQGPREVHQLLTNTYKPKGIKGLCQPGDRVWIRETWWQAHDYPGTLPCGEPTPISWNRTRLIHYAADGDPPNTPNRHYPQGLQGKSISAPDPHAVWIKRPSIHFPRWAARIVLPVVSVRAERVRDISEADAIQEGVEPLPLTRRTDDRPRSRDHRTAFQELWADLYGAKHPPETTWCWVIETELFKGASK